MVTTTEIYPHPALRSFVRCYAYRTFDTHGTEMIKPIHAMHEFFLTFWLQGGKIPGLKFSKNETAELISGHDKQVLGLQTAYRGQVIFNGRYRLFSIQFRPNGFYRIFGIPMQQVTNQILSSEDVLGKEAVYLIQQLTEALDHGQMATLANNFLFKFLNKSKATDPYHRLTQISNLLAHPENMAYIPKLAHMANMSMRTFERHFGEQVGITPKLFSKISRFNHSVLLKMLHPEKTWTTISATFGYFDQNHFVKDFKRFSGVSPSLFLKLMPPPVEKFNQIIG